MLNFILQKVMVLVVLQQSNLKGLAKFDSQGCSVQDSSLALWWTMKKMPSELQYPEGAYAPPLK